MAFSDHVPKLFHVDFVDKGYDIHMTRYTMDLEQLCRYYPDLMTDVNVNYITYHLLLALRDCHSVGLLHQDVNPTNVLINMADGRITKVALGDWGWAQSINVNHQPSEEIQTLHYRAPEVALGMCGYTAAIDIWSVGAILYRMKYGKMLVRGANALEDVMAIFELYGTPNYAKEHFPHFESKATTDSPVDDLLSHLLDPNPQTRFTITQALNHTLFDRLRPDMREDIPLSPSCEKIIIDASVRRLGANYTKTAMRAASVYHRIMMVREPEYNRQYSAEQTIPILLRLASLIYEPHIERSFINPDGYRIQDWCLRVLDYNLFIDDIIPTLPKPVMFKTPLHVHNGHFNFRFGARNVWRDKTHEYRIVPYSESVLRRYTIKGWELMLTPASVPDYSIIRKVRE